MMLNPWMPLVADVTQGAYVKHNCGTSASPENNVYQQCDAVSTMKIRPVPRHTAIQ